MAAKRLNLESVRRLALALTGVEESTMWGAPAFKAGGKMFACVPTHKSAEPDSVVVRIDFDRRAELLAEAPGTYYVTEHYLNYPIVLIRLSCVSADALQDLLKGARRFVGSERERRTRPASGRARSGKRT